MPEPVEWLIVLMTDVAGISETAANFYETTMLKNPEDSYIQSFVQQINKSNYIYIKLEQKEINCS